MLQTAHRNAGVLAQVAISMLETLLNDDEQFTNEINKIVTEIMGYVSRMNELDVDTEMPVDDIPLDIVDTIGENNMTINLPPFTILRNDTEGAIRKKIINALGIVGDAAEKQRDSYAVDIQRAKDDCGGKGLLELSDQGITVRACPSGYVLEHVGKDGRLPTSIKIDPDAIS